MNVALARKRHESFCLHYMSTLNGSQSALAAGYSARNPKNAHIIAWTLLKREDVQARIAQLREAASDDAIMTLIQRKVVLSEIARARMSDYRDEHGRLIPLDKDVPNRAAIASVEYAYDPVKCKPYPVRINLRDPVDAIVELSKLDGTYKQKPMSVAAERITGVSVVQTARAKISTKTGIKQIEDAPPGEQEKTSG